MKVERIEKHGREIWSNVKMDELRKKECLCLNCRYMRVCDIAHKFYNICKTRDIALMVTRCPNWEEHHQ